MIIPSKKCQYALRAVYELAKRQGQGPIKTSTIAQAQAIPHKFLEVILNQLKGSGLVVSKRGFYGGYTIARSPEQISVGEVLRYVHKSHFSGDDCVVCISQQECPFAGKCAFSALWKRVLSAAFTIYDATSLQDLLDDSASVGVLNSAGIGKN